jgi:hypothetical protein
VVLAYALTKAFTPVHEIRRASMTVNNSSGRHRHPKHRLTRALATALLITLLIGVPAAATMDRPAAYVTQEER